MKPYYHTFRVTGKGRVPDDMLRYDHCFPASQSLLNAEIGYTTLGTIAPKGWKPSAGRWMSFGWNVSHHTTTTVAW